MAKGGGGGKASTLCEPDASTLGGFATVLESLKSLHAEVCGEHLYLPDPATIALEGKAYTGHRRGEAYGTAQVQWSRLGAPLPARFRLTFDGEDLRVRVVGEVPGAAEGSTVEHTWDGVVTEGAGVCLFKGVHHAYYFAAEDDRRTHAAEAGGPVHACLRTPFACFQKTKSGEVPQSVHSAMGLRRAGLTDRVFTIIAPAPGGALKTERVGRVGVDECSAQSLFDALPRAPRLVLATMMLARDGVDAAQRSIPGNPKTRGIGNSNDELVEV